MKYTLYKSVYLAHQLLHIQGVVLQMKIDFVLAIMAFTDK